MSRLRARNSGNGPNASEISKYLNAPLVSLNQGDPLPWWKANADEFPTLSRMARDILSIPLTSVSVERVFSTARDVIPYRRNRLSPTMIEKLLIAKCWLRKSISEREEQMDIDRESKPVDFHDIENVAGFDIMDMEFLRRMIPQDDANLDSDTNIMSDLENSSDDFSELSNPQKRKAKQQTPVINSILTGRLHKHVKMNYQV